MIDLKNKIYLAESIFFENDKALNVIFGDLIKIQESATPTLTSCSFDTDNPEIGIERTYKDYSKTVILNETTYLDNDMIEEIDYGYDIRGNILYKGHYRDSSKTYCL